MRITIIPISILTIQSYYKSCARVTSEAHNGRVCVTPKTIVENARPTGIDVNVQQTIRNKPYYAQNRVCFRIYGVCFFLNGMRPLFDWQYRNRNVLFR